jgi:hypothetical protein
VLSVRLFAVRSSALLVTFAGLAAGRFRGRAAEPFTPALSGLLASSGARTTPRFSALAVPFAPLSSTLLMPGLMLFVRLSVAAFVLPSALFARLSVAAFVLPSARFAAPWSAR